MKTRPLPDLDVARIAPLPREQKRKALESMKLGRPPYSYDPMRRSILDILNIEAGPLAPVPRAPWSLIEAAVRRQSRSADEETANVAVAKALYDYATLQSIVGRRHDIFPLNIGVSEKLIYWSQAVVAVDGRPVVPFIDPRRATKRLTAGARRFVFSVMHERFMADPDLSEVEMCIVQFASQDNGDRTPVLYFADGLELHDFDALDAMVQETYAIWNEVLEERDAEARRGTGTTGPLL